MATWKKIGKIGLPQGLNGAFYLVGDRQTEPSASSIVIGDDPSCGIPAAIESQKNQQGQWVLKIRGIDGRMALQALRGQSLWIEVGENTEQNLEGVRILDSNGDSVGKIVAVTNYGASDIVVIESEAKGLIDLPLIEDYFFLPPSSERTLEIKLSENTLSDLWYQ